ncbi:Heterokaryon incompatibility protein [Pleurostoma richardsiae]|uniref:Heterokaryon incompatibility protein n=1 Tax=Pleurostoma richardsiae TaxID=41990 RepID=A0AA38VIZ5_9PEZI|nr:Heterokaryon incompatibility protein [Pleurostoma richardsiae]
MRGGVSKPRAACRSHRTLTRASQEKWLDVVASNTPELPTSRDHSRGGGDLTQVTTPLQSSKRQLDAASTSVPSPAKRAPSAQTDTHRGSPRRSARLQGQRLASSRDYTSPSSPSFGWQTETGPGALGSERPWLTGRNTQPEAEDEQTEETTEIAQRLKPPKRSSTSLLEAKVKGQERVSSTSLRKRQIASADDNGNERQRKRARLTQKNLALFNKMGKKKGTSKASTSTPSESIVESSSAKTTSTTTSGFAIQAYKNGILDPFKSQPPTNLEDIHKRVDQSRETASPPESVYNRYVDKVAHATNEATMVFEDVGFNTGLSTPQPDFVEGLRMEDYRPFPINEHINGAVLYRDDPYSVTLPHLAGEWKGRGKDMDEARLQSAYDGAALVYARNQALSYLGRPDPPGHAEVTTFTTDGTNINLFAHYAAPSEDGTLEYHQYRIKSTNLIDSHQGLKDGRRGLRNEQQHAKEQSYALRDQLKEHWQQQRDVLHPVAEAVPLPVADGTVREMNADEAGYVVVEQPCQPTPAASSSVSSSKSLPPPNNHVPSSGGHKRKASSSQRPSHESSRPRSKGGKYWKWDAESGNYFHRHSDGTVTWLEDPDDES